MKKLSLLALVMALVVSLTGCFGGDTKLYNAFNKMQDIRTMESETELSFTFKGEGFTPEEEMMLQQVANMLNTTKFNIYQKSEANEGNTISKGEAKIQMDLGGIVFPINLWVDMDVSEDEMKLVEIFELPPMLLGSMFPQAADKQYLVYDLGELMEMAAEEVDMAEVMELAKELEPKMVEFVEKIEKDFKPDINMVEKKDSKEIDGEKLSIYEIKLDDASLKELIKYTVEYMLENEAFAELMKEYMSVVAEIAINQGDLTEEEVKEASEELEKLVPELKEKFNGFMEKIQDIKILGEDGITIELGINKEGYIVHEAGNIDLQLDIGSIAKAMGQEIPGEAKVINFGINYKTKVYNINNEDIKVEMPETNEDNSVSYIELMKMLEEQLNSIQTMPEVPTLP